MSNPEKFCLKWNDFQQNISSAFGFLRNETNFADVTLVCQDSQQIEAHKVILTASSPFFLNLFLKNKQANPLIYMRGMNSEDLMAIIDFLYNGEANVYQENLDNFLNIAEELQLKGLTNRQRDDHDETVTNESAKEYKIIEPKQEMNKTLIQGAKTFANDPSCNIVVPDMELAVSEMKVVVPFTPNEGLSILDSQIKSMMTVGQNSMPNGKRVNVCNVCGKEGERRTIVDHIETHHIEGVTHPCNFCNKTFRSRPSLKAHYNSQHKQ